jgi:hypothetical protein
MAGAALGLSLSANGTEPGEDQQAPVFHFASRKARGFYGTGNREGMSRGPSGLVPLVAKKQNNNDEENQPANQTML